MKHSLAWLLVLAMLFSVNAGCSRVQKVVVTQGVINEPHESIGSIEVERQAPRIPYRRIFGQLWAWVTFGHVENISREDYLRGLLNKKMLKAAQNGHNADAVIHVTYWPDLTAKKFPQGRIYGKGEMVRYKRFSA